MDCNHHFIITQTYSKICVYYCITKAGTSKNFKFIPDVPKMLNYVFSVLAIPNSCMFFTTSEKTVSSEKNVTKIIEFGWVGLIL